jgi:uncharacterized linocin/CFP29 family protein
MNDLQRELAPVSDAAWGEIDDEARNTLKATLAARRIVDFHGPLGWDASAISLGRTAPVEKTIQDGVEAHTRKIQPLVELRVPFELKRAELEVIGRGAEDADLDPVRKAARAMALAEDRAVFHGFGAAQIEGIMEAAAESACTITEDYAAYLGVVAEAVHELRRQSVGGPYAIALGPRCFTGLSKTMIGGFPAIDQVRRLLDGPIIPAPAVDGALVVSLRGGDFSMTVGQDFSIGYLGHNAKRVSLYLQESLTFRVVASEAAVPLRYSA